MAAPPALRRDLLADPRGPFNRPPSGPSSEGRAIERESTEDLSYPIDRSYYSDGNRKTEWASGRGRRGERHQESGWELESVADWGTPTKSDLARGHSEGPPFHFGCGSIRMDVQVHFRSMD